MRPSAKPASPRGLPTRGQRAVALLLLAAVFASILGYQGFAANSGKTIMLGESLNDPQRQELLDYFGAKSNDRVETITVAETQDAMKEIIARPISSAYSSIAFTCRDLGDGLEVKTRNITIITPSLYAMALVTAGIGDGELLVAAPNDAPAEGMTALTGVFKTWEIAPCDSGTTSKERQRLALEELALAVEIGQTVGTPNAVQAAGNLVLYTQQAVVIDDLTKADEISDAIAQQELLQGITVPAPLRERLVDFMVRLAKEKIDWSTFSAGWEITPTNDGTGISMKGDGIAIRNAQMTATARAADQMTQTAKAAKDQTATAAANARATENALSAAMTATAAARPTKTPTPTPTPTPEPTATPTPVAMSGTIDRIDGNQVIIKPAGGGAPTAYIVPEDAALTRDGKVATVGELRKGDSVSLSVDGPSSTVRQMSASAPAPGLLSRLKFVLVVIPVLAIVALAVLLKGRAGGMGDPFIVKRVVSA